MSRQRNKGKKTTCVSDHQRTQLIFNLKKRNNALYTGHRTDQMKPKYQEKSQLKENENTREIFCQ